MKPRGSLSLPMYLPTMQRSRHLQRRLRTQLSIGSGKKRFLVIQPPQRQQFFIETTSGQVDALIFQARKN